MRALKNPKSKYFHDIVCVSMIVFELMIHSYTYIYIVLRIFWHWCHVVIHGSRRMVAW